MANAAIAYQNLADAGTWTATSAETLMPVSRLQNEHIGKRWRSTAEPATITVDLTGAASNVSIDTVALLGLTLGSTATIQVLISSSAGGVASGNLNGGGVTYSSADEEFKPDYGALILPLAAPVSARYVRFVITDGPASYVEAGRGFVGLREAFTYNFAPGGGIAWTDLSRKTKTPGGQTLIFPDSKFRSAEINLEWVSAAQREGLIESIDHINGQSIDCLLILDTASNNLPRDSIFGLLTQPTPTLYTAIPDIFSRAVRIEERL